MQAFKQNKQLRILLVLFACLNISSCSTTSYHDETLGINDPFEEVNRTVFAFNDTVDNAIMKPVAKTYRAALPKPARTGIRNFITNLRSPIDIGNQILQGDIIGAADGITRTFVNTFFGIGGFIDIAAKEGLEYENEDFGQTMAVWGIGNGPYIVLPLIGPNNLRDHLGTLADSYADPIRLYLHNTDNEEIYYSKFAVEVIDKREELLDVLSDLKANSIDYYAAIRGVIYQKRNALIKDMKENDQYALEMPDFDDDWE